MPRSVSNDSEENNSRRPSTTSVVSSGMMLSSASMVIESVPPTVTITSPDDASMISVNPDASRVSVVRFPEPTTSSPKTSWNPQEARRAIAARQTPAIAIRRRALIGIEPTPYQAGRACHMQRVRWMCEGRTHASALF